MNQPCPNIEHFDERLVKAARELPDKWVGPPLGDVGYGDAPYHLCTKVATIYQQHNNPYCVSHSLASALYYCNSDWIVACQALVQLGHTFSGTHFDYQIEKVKELMEDHVPHIGRPVIFGRRTKNHHRKLRKMSWEELFSELTPFPTMVVPMLPSGQATHAFCVVDDLIFDSTTPCALKLCMDSVQWLSGEEIPHLYQVYRFCMKCSPKGQRVPGVYKRIVQFHWDHPARPKMS